MKGDLLFLMPFRYLKTRKKWKKKMYSIGKKEEIIPFLICFFFSFFHSKKMRSVWGSEEVKVEIKK